MMKSGRPWRALMAVSPRRIASELDLRRSAALLRRSELFDAAWYLDAYPDVAAARIDPVRHYLRIGAAEGRDPGPHFSTIGYLERHPEVASVGINPLLHYLEHGAKEGDAVEDAAREMAARRATGLVPLHGFRAPAHAGPRVTLLTDSLGADSLFGGVATAILFTTLLARRRSASLRIITEMRAPDQDAVADVLRTHGVAPPDDISFAFAERSRPDRREIDLADDELFVSTAWWNTWNLLQAASPRQIVHLLQEDERMFHPHGDLHLLASEVLTTPGLRFAVNTRLLYEHFAAEGFGNIARDGVWFEPAFPLSCYHWEERATDTRQDFFFYARPRHPRNLYLRGMEVLRAAIERRILDPDHWRISLLGRDLNKVMLPRGVRPRVLQNLSWSEYAAVVRRTDLGLCLMYTPHPSYPPLDLAASGAVAVTNRYGRKQSLTAYSPNILCADPDVESLLAGLEEGVRLAADLSARRRNYAQNGIARDWDATLAPAIDRLLGD
jgi:hypothetical protein